MLPSVFSLSRIMMGMHLGNSEVALVAKMLCCGQFCVPGSKRRGELGLKTSRGDSNLERLFFAYGLHWFFHCSLH